MRGPASAATAAIAHDARVAEREEDDDADQGRVGDGPHPEHRRRPDSVDVPSGDRRPDTDGDRVERDDDPGGAVPSALSADEEEERERRHPERQATEQRPAEHGPRVWEPEQLAVVPGAARRAGAGGHVARTTSGAQGVPVASRTTPPAAVRGCTVSVVPVTVTCA